MSKVGVYFDEFSLVSQTTFYSKGLTVRISFQAYSFWGLTMLSFGLSVVWVLAFESPIVVLEKIIFGGRKKKNTLEENENKNGAPA